MLLPDKELDVDVRQLLQDACKRSRDDVRRVVDELTELLCLIDTASHGQPIVASLLMHVDVIDRIYEMTIVLECSSALPNARVTVSPRSYSTFAISVTAGARSMFPDAEISAMASSNQHAIEMLRAIGFIDTPK